MNASTANSTSFRGGPLVDYGCANIFASFARHWRDRAGQARAHATKMNDLESRRMMIVIADGYDNLARRAEEKLRDAKSKNESMSWQLPPIGLSDSAPRSVERPSGRPRL
jgi:hypothetical protein